MCKEHDKCIRLCAYAVYSTYAYVFVKVCMCVHLPEHQYCGRSYLFVITRSVCTSNDYGILSQQILERSRQNIFCSSEIFTWLWVPCTPHCSHHLTGYLCWNVHLPVCWFVDVNPKPYTLNISPSLCWFFTIHHTIRW